MLTYRLSEAIRNTKSPEELDRLDFDYISLSLAVANNKPFSLDDVTPTFGDILLLSLGFEEEDAYPFFMVTRKNDQLFIAKAFTDVAQADKCFKDELKSLMEELPYLFFDHEDYDQKLDSVCDILYA